MKVLLTNDDGILATGLQTLRRALLAVPGVELAVIAPDGNRSAAARAITTRRPLKVTQVDFDDGTHGFATDGTPVDCVRLATHGLVEGFSADMVVSGINHGANLGTDVFYSGTVGAALEAIILGRDGIAVSQQSTHALYDGMPDAESDHFQAVADFTASLVRDWERLPTGDATIVNVNGPTGTPKGVKVTHLGQRVYNEDLVFEGETEDGEGRHVGIYLTEPNHERVEGTDLTAVDDGYIAVTPIHLDLSDHEAIGGLRSEDLDALLPAEDRG